MIRQTATLLIAVFLLLSLSAQNQNNNARVKFLIGKVQVLGAKKTTWKKARMNQAIYSGDRIKTNLNSRLELEMPDESVIKIHENTIFDVKSIKTAARDNKDEMKFTLFAGNIWAKFKKLVNTRQTRQIESPSAVVAIRGTTIEMSVDQNKRTVVRVLEGKVSVRSKDVAGEVLVGANQESTIEKGKAPTPPRPSSKTEGTGEDAAEGALKLEIKPGKLQFTDAAVLISGIPVSGRINAGAKVFANGIPINVNANGLFKGRVQAQEGINEIHFTARLNNQTTKQVLRVLVNTKRPQIRLSKPIVAGFINRRDYSLSGAIFDATPKDKIKVYINNELVAEIFGQGTFNRTIILNEGKNNIRVSAVDFSKNTIEKAETIFLDTVRPILTITNPAQPVSMVKPWPPRPPVDNPNYNFLQDRIHQTIRGIVIDPAPSSGIKRIMVNGKEIRPNSDGSFETEIVLAKAKLGQLVENRLSFYVEDMAGNITRDNSRVIRILGGSK